MKLYYFILLFFCFGTIKAQNKEPEFEYYMTYNISEWYNNSTKQFEPAKADHKLVWDVYMNRKTNQIILQDSVTHDYINIEIASQVKRNDHLIYYIDSDTTKYWDFFTDKDFYIIEYVNKDNRIRYKNRIIPTTNKK